MGYKEAKEIATRQHVTGHLQRKEDDVAKELGTRDMRVVRDFIYDMQKIEAEKEALRLQDENSW